MNNDIIEDAIAAGLLHIPAGHEGKPLEQPTYGTMQKLAKFAALRDARKSEQTDVVKDAIDFDNNKVRANVCERYPADTHRSIIIDATIREIRNLIGEVK